MPVVKNDWDIYNSQRSRRTSESADKAGIGGRMRKVSESRSEGPAFSPRTSSNVLSPHRSAPAMRSVSYGRMPPSRVSLRAQDSPKGLASPPSGGRESDKFHSRARAASPERKWHCTACMPYLLYEVVTMSGDFKTAFSFKNPEGLGSFSSLGTLDGSSHIL
ncbi:unnamed protein product [Leptosia nina]|uniref:Uncharacterized protein n=1 Tax=Leptosia nina TaxID=320188 RepID=A0AAV1J3U1_9NEOP